DRKGLGKLDTTVGLHAPDDVVGRGVKIRPAAMTVECKFFTMRGYSRHNRLCRCLSVFERRGSKGTAHDHARVHMPRLRLKAELDSDAVLAWPSRSSSLPNALTENGQVGSRNNSKTRGPWPQTSGSARQVFFIRIFPSKCLVSYAATARRGNRRLSANPAA